MKRCLLCLMTFILCISSFTLSAQDFNVPEAAVLKTADDYKTYEKDVIDGINWITNTPLDEQKDKRKEVNAFLMRWMTGTPTVSIEVSSYLVEISEKNPELLILFLSGWTKFAIENPDNSDAFQGNLAGMKMVLEVYEKNKKSGIKKDRALEKLLKRKSDEDLEKWIQKKLKS